MPKNFKVAFCVSVYSDFFFVFFFLRLFGLWLLLLGGVLLAPHNYAIIYALCRTNTPHNTDKKLPMTSHSTLLHRHPKPNCCSKTRTRYRHSMDITLQSFAHINTYRKLCDNSRIFFFSPLLNTNVSW